MKARYRATCTNCNNTIHLGDEIKKRGFERRSAVWVHDVCPNPESIIQPGQEAAARACGVDSTFVAFVGRLLLEHDSEDAAWAEFCDLNEHWDGEQDYRAAALARWQATLPFAHAQNSLIHPREGAH